MLHEDKQDEWIMKLHKLQFDPWLKKESIKDDGSFEAETVKMLARDPGTLVTSWQGYDMNGWIFYTKQKAMKSKSQRNKKERTTGKGNRPEKGKNLLSAVLDINRRH